MKDFLNHVLRKEYRSWRLFAHFGGRFDVHYVFDWLRKNASDLPLEIYCSGSSVISLTLHLADHYFRFCDSYRLLPKSLETLTYDFDVKHKKLTGRAFTDRLYNEHDCRGLYEVLEMFFDEFDICSQTIASHAMRVYRTNYMPHELYQPHRDVEEFCREGYSGGRCEIYRYDRAELNHYDVNSLFPCAMLQPVPVRYLFTSKELPEDDDKRIGFYRAEVSYPERYLPILPWHSDKLYFPVGDFEGVFTSLELKKAIADGAKIKIIDGRVFQAEAIMREYALALFEMKRKAEIAGQTGRRYIAKILMNSLYGKWGQRREQKSYIVDDGRPEAWPLPNGLAYVLTESRSNHIMPHIAATITARARLMQWELLNRARNWYTDTDSLFTDSTYPVSDSLGALHYEGRGAFQAYGLKEYFFDGAYKIKGLPRSKNDDIEARAREDFELAEKFLDGGSVPGERMRGWQESIRAGLETVARIPTIRQRLQVRDKRAASGEFDTRPWNARELIAKELVA